MEFTFKASPYLSKSGSWSDPKARRQFAHNIRTESQCGDTFIFGESVAGTDCDPTISFIRPNLPEGNGDFQTNEVERPTGYRPQTFQVWSREHRSNFTAALARMLRILRPSQVEMTLSPPIAFQHYLRQERGLSEATITRYTPIVSAFLAECSPAGISDFHQISAGKSFDHVALDPDVIGLTKSSGGGGV
jgi:hypothetical protein